MAKNPYIHQTRSELFDSAQNRAGKLFGGPHSDIAHLLLAMAMQLHNANMATRGPGGQLKGSGGLMDAYSQRLELLQRNARYEVLRDAADVALGSKAGAWLQPGSYDGSPCERGMASDAGLVGVLAELDAIRKK
jgi:hypothetical protein